MKGTITLMSVVATLALAPLSSAGADPSSTNPPPAAESAGPAPDPATANTRLAALVPAGMTTREACTGFKDLADCSAALHASQNLNIAFPDVRARLLGGQTLEAAIHALKPAVDSKREVRRAEQQASEDLRPLG
ncbi:MAG: hypothetical protein KGJ68_06500 [Gammaproteobacteria bacterium]|nr:hypothetical protein [Gammaproteobacteria bacterium]